MRFLKLASTLLLLAGFVAGAANYFVHRPYSGFQNEIFVQIPKGSSVRTIARLLTEAGAVEHSWEFLLARALRPGLKLQAGEYRFADPASPLEIYTRIAHGDIFYYELALPEGLNMFDIASAVERVGLMPASDFLAAARDPSAIHDLAPSAPTLEGYLFPDTYRVARGTSASELCRILTQRFRTEWNKLGTSADPQATVTLASLIEKEAAVPADRPLIASVFRNRLKLGMKLDCDPTTIYAALIEGRYRGVIHQSDLTSANPYNTYQHAGLPPGPIANPGRASLEAALHPADGDFLYFVARPDGSGRHQFSKDLATHRVAATRYRRGHAR